MDAKTKKTIAIIIVVVLCIVFFLVLAYLMGYQVGFAEAIDEFKPIVDDLSSRYYVEI